MHAVGIPGNLCIIYTGCSCPLIKYDGKLWENAGGKTGIANWLLTR